MTQHDVRKYRRKSNLYLDCHRLPNGDLLITASGECRKDLRAQTRERRKEGFDGLPAEREQENLTAMIEGEGWEWADDTVTCWGGPVIAEWGPLRAMTERERDYYVLEGRRDRSMYWLKFDGESDAEDGWPLVRDQVLCFQYAAYELESAVDELRDQGYCVWHCGADWADDREDPLEEVLTATERGYYVAQPILFGRDNLPPYVPHGDDTGTYHGLVPRELQRVWADGGYRPLAEGL